LGRFSLLQKKTGAFFILKCPVSFGAWDLSPYFFFHSGKQIVKRNNKLKNDIPRIVDNSQNIGKKQEKEVTSK